MVPRSSYTCTFLGVYLALGFGSTEKTCRWFRILFPTEQDDLAAMSGCETEAHFDVGPFRLEVRSSLGWNRKASVHRVTGTRLLFVPRRGLEDGVGFRDAAAPTLAVMERA